MGWTRLAKPTLRMRARAAAQVLPEHIREADLLYSAPYVCTYLESLITPVAKNHVRPVIYDLN